LKRTAVWPLNRDISERTCRNRAGDSMPTDRVTPRSIDEYIAAFSPEVRAILERVRLTIAKAAPEAQESISYRIPTFTLNGALVYFAAFKRHIGFYPPVTGDPIRLDRKNRQAQSETESGEGGCQEHAAAVNGRCPA
jgi:hypothetical protein